MISDDEADRRFRELAELTFGPRVTPLLLAELGQGNVQRAQELLDADDKARALREAPRECAPEEAP